MLAADVCCPLINLACGHFCHLLKTFANSLDQDQDQQNVGPDLDPNCLTLLVFNKFFKKVDLKKKISRQNKSIQNYPIDRVNHLFPNIHRKQCKINIGIISQLGKISVLKGLSIVCCLEYFESKFNIFLVVSSHVSPGSEDHVFQPISTGRGPSKDLSFSNSFQIHPIVFNKKIFLSFPLLPWQPMLCME